MLLYFVASILFNELNILQSVTLISGNDCGRLRTIVTSEMNFQNFFTSFTLLFASVLESRAVSAAELHQKFTLSIGL